MGSYQTANMHARVKSGIKCVVQSSVLAINIWYNHTYFYIVFIQGSYMALDVTHDDITTFSTQLKIKLRSLDDGLILYDGAEVSRRRRKRAAASNDVFTSIAMVNGSLEFRFSCGSGLYTNT